MKFTIYTLSDPRTNMVKYVGCTSNLKKRMWGHRSNKYPNNVSLWVREMLKMGLNPTVTKIELVDEELAAEKEKYYIDYYSQNFDLLNMVSGGGGLKVGKSSGENNPMFGVRLVGEKNPFFGKTHSEVTRKLLREKCGHVGDNPVWNKGKHGIYSSELIEQMKSNQPGRRPIIVMDENDNIIHEFVSKRECCRKLKIDRKQLEYILTKRKSQNPYKGMIFVYGN